MLIYWKCLLFNDFNQPGHVFPPLRMAYAWYFTYLCYFLWMCAYIVNV